MKERLPIGFDLRKAAIVDSHKECEKLGGNLWLTGHFVERINLRSNDQVETFLLYTKCISHILQQRGSLMNKTVEYKTPKETMIFRIQDFTVNPRPNTMKDVAFQLVGITYYLDTGKLGELKVVGTADKIFRIGQK